MSWWRTWLSRAPKMLKRRDRQALLPMQPGTFEAHELSRLDGHLHDLWADFDAATQSGDELRIPIASKTTRAAADAVFDYELVLHRVRAWRLEDPDKIAKYGVNHLRYDAATHTIRLEGVPDAVLYVDVEGFFATLRHATSQL